MTRKCFACDRKLGANPYIAVTLDEQVVQVGSECWKKIGLTGYQPPKGGPALYRGRFAPNGDLLEILAVF